MHANFIIFHFVFSVLLLFVCKKFNVLIDIKSEKHKKFSSNSKVPFSTTDSSWCQGNSGERRNKAAQKLTGNIRRPKWLL